LCAPQGALHPLGALVYISSTFSHRTLIMQNTILWVRGLFLCLMPKKTYRFITFFKLGPLSMAFGTFNLFFRITHYGYFSPQLKYFLVIMKPSVSGYKLLTKEEHSSVLCETTAIFRRCCWHAYLNKNREFNRKLR